VEGVDMNKQADSRKPEGTQIIKPWLKFMVGFFAGLCAAFVPRISAQLNAFDEENMVMFSSSYLVLSISCAAIIGAVVVIMEWGVKREPKATFMMALGLPALISGGLNSASNVSSMQDIANENTKLQTALKQTTDIEEMESSQLFWVDTSDGKQTQNKTHFWEISSAYAAQDNYKNRQQYKHLGVHRVKKNATAMKRRTTMSASTLRQGASQVQKKRMPKASIKNVPARKENPKIDHRIANKKPDLQHDRAAVSTPSKATNSLGNHTKDNMHALQKAHAKVQGSIAGSHVKTGVNTMVSKPRPAGIGSKKAIVPALAATAAVAVLPQTEHIHDDRSQPQIAHRQVGRLERERSSSISLLNAPIKLNHGLYYVVIQELKSKAQVKQDAAKIKRNITDARAVRAGNKILIIKSTAFSKSEALIAAIKLKNRGYMPRIIRAKQ